jgi:CheY-like chemotaxis protein
MLSLRRSTRRNVSSPSTVVCVDDNEFVLEVLDWYLESQGYKVVQCSNASQAVEIVEEVRPVAVTLDFEMPVMDGAAVAAAIKSKVPHLPIVMFSGSTEIPQQTLDLVDCFVSKDAVNGFGAVAKALDWVLAAKRKVRGMHQAIAAKRIA